MMWIRKPDNLSRLPSEHPVRTKLVIDSLQEHHPYILYALLCVALSTGVVFHHLNAGPQGENVTHGDAKVQHVSDQLTKIDQNTSRAIIEYSSFEVGEKETVRFNQPGPEARVLNRIQSSDPTEIRGKLSANGKVFLTNPSGILFGPKSMVDVGKLYAAAGHLSTHRFLEGKNRFVDLDGTVRNLGELNGNGIHLLGKRVVNFGTIQADQGAITLTSGHDVLVGTRDGHIFTKIKDAGEPTGKDKAGIQNEGTVASQDGTVKMSAGDMFATSIFNNGGNVKGETIELNGADHMTKVIGQLDASDRVANEPGSRIKIVGAELNLSDATIKASGSSGGTVSIEGVEVQLDSNSIIDAKGHNDGGSVTINAEERFSNSGTITTSGETGGKIHLNANHLNQQGTVSASGSDGGGKITFEGGTYTGGGSLQATGENDVGGKISLDINGSYTATSSETIDVSGKKGGGIRIFAQDEIISSGTYQAYGVSGTGGWIEISSGSSIGFLSSTLLAGGTTGGGDISLGGYLELNDKHDPLPAAPVSSVSQGSVIDASSTGKSGDGGQVRIWSDDLTRFYGSIDARPGSSSGNGGMVEISSRGKLTYTGNGKVSTGRGERVGNVLIDPKDIIITNSPPSGESFALELVTQENRSVNNNTDDPQFTDSDGFVIDEKDKFGSDVSFNETGTILAVGAQSGDGNENGVFRSGAVYLFTIDTESTEDPAFSSEPALEQVIHDGRNIQNSTGDGQFTDSDGFVLDDRDRFGSSVSLNSAGDLLAVGARFDEGEDNSLSNMGAAYLFSIDTETTEDPAFEGLPTLQQVIRNGRAINNNTGDDRFTDSDGFVLKDSDVFGTSVSLNGAGDVLAVGAVGDNGENGTDGFHGASYLFSIDTETTDDPAFTSLPALEQVIREGRDIDNNTGESQFTDSDGFVLDSLTNLFGSGLSLNKAGDVLAVGAKGDDGEDGTVTRGGATYIFSLDIESVNDPSFSSLPALQQVIRDGRMLNNSTGDDQLTDTDGFVLNESDNLGTGVSLSASGNTLAVGASDDDGEDGTVTNSGAVYLFTIDTEASEDPAFNNAPELEQVIRDGRNLINNSGESTFTNSDGFTLDESDQFGGSVALDGSGDILAVGTSFDDGFGNTTDRSGAFYVFSKISSSASIGSPIDGFSDNATSRTYLVPAQLTDLLENGNTVHLEANNDIVVNSIIDSSGASNTGALTMQAGRDIKINADILLNGPFSGTYNASSAMADHRDNGEASFVMNTDTKIDTSSVNGSITINSGTGPSGNENTGTINISSLNAGNGDINLNFFDESDGTLDVGTFTGSSTILSGTSNNDTLTIKGKADTNEIMYHGKGGSDSLILDFSSGNPVPAKGINFNAGSSGSGDGDELILTQIPDPGSGSGFPTQIFNMTGSKPEGNSGEIILKNGTNRSRITFAGLDPITNEGAADDITFNLGTANNDATLQDHTSVSGQIQLISNAGSFENTTFSNPNNSITVNGEGGSDTLRIESLDPGFSANVNLHGGGGTDTTRVQSAVLNLTGFQGNTETVNLLANVTGPISGSASQVNVLSDAAEIQDGVDVAAKNATVSVNSGTFDGLIEIAQPVNLKGANAGIQGTGERNAETVIDQDGFFSIQPKEEGITIDGFRFEGKGSRVIDTTQSTPNLTIKNNVFTHKNTGSSTGIIQLSGGTNYDNLSISRNEFMDKGDAKAELLINQDGGTINGMRVIDNRFGGNSTGIFLNGGTLSGAVVQNNTFSGGIGMNMGEAGDIVIRENTFDGTSVSGFQVGIQGGKIVRNIFKNIAPSPDSSAHAFELWGGEFGTAVSENVTIKQNVIHFNDSEGPNNEPVHGIRLRKYPNGAGIDASTITVKENEFANGRVSSNAKAIRHFGDQATAVDASANWLGTTNDILIADNLINGPTDFTPFLDSGTDQAETISGFQGSFSVLHVTHKGSQTGSKNRIQEAVDLIQEPGSIITSGVSGDTFFFVDSSTVLLVGQELRDSIQSSPEQSTSSISPTRELQSIINTTKMPRFGTDETLLSTEEGVIGSEEDGVLGPVHDGVLNINTGDFEYDSMWDYLQGVTAPE